MGVTTRGAAAAASPAQRKRSAKTAAADGPMEVLDSTTRFLTRADVALAFHACAFVLYVRVWAWHTTPAASALPGATGFGWFFRYLTFCSYTLQLGALALSLAAALAAKRGRAPRAAARAAAAADVLSCATFGIANTVTALYFAIESSTAGLVEGGRGARPWWLALSVHVLNSAVAWADLVIVEERSFCGRSRHVALGLGAAYVAWSLVVRAAFGKFPYPILNALPFPWGWAAFAATGLALLLGLHELGRLVKHGVLRDGPGRRRRRPRRGAG